MHDSSHLLFGIGADNTSLTVGDRSTANDIRGYRGNNIDYGLFINNQSVITPTWGIRYLS